MSTYDTHRSVALEHLERADALRRLPDDAAFASAHLQTATAQVHATLALAAATADTDVDDPIDLVPTSGAGEPLAEWERELLSAGRPDPGPIRSVYVASSWRNTRQPAAVKMLRDLDLEVYDFRNPPGGTGFSWDEVGIDPVMDGTSRSQAFLAALDHPRAIEGYQSDFDAMLAADTFVLVLPCGRSAHLELGWAVGQGKRTAIWLDDPVRPELMYRMVDVMTPSLGELRQWAKANR